MGKYASLARGEEMTTFTIHNKEQADCDISAQLKTFEQ